MLRRQQLAQHGVFAQAVEFLIDDLRGFGLDAVVVLLDRFLHAIRAVLVREIGDYGYLLVAGRLGLDLRAVHDDFGVEYLLLDRLLEAVGHGPDEHPLRERRDFRGRDQAVHLRRYGGRFVVAAQGHALPLLQHLAEPLRKHLGRFAHHLPGEDVADGVHHHGGLLVAVVALELGEVLKASDGDTKAGAELLPEHRGAEVSGNSITLYYTEKFEPSSKSDYKYRVPILLTPGKNGSCDSWQISWFTKAGKKAFYKMEFKSIAQ